MSRPNEAAGYEIRDVNAGGVVVTVLAFALVSAALLAFLWELSRRSVADVTRDGARPPVVLPGEPPVTDRVRAVPPPWLEGLKPDPPSFHPEDLRADRQPQLRGYGWVDRGKRVARIPIGRAMDAVAEKGGRP